MLVLFLFPVNGVSDFGYERDAIRTDAGSNKTTKKSSTKNRRKRNFIPPKRYRWDREAIPYMLDKSLGEGFDSS